MQNISMVSWNQQPSSTEAELVEVDKVKIFWRPRATKSMTPKPTRTIRVLSYLKRMENHWVAKEEGISIYGISLSRTVSAQSKHALNTVLQQIWLQISSPSNWLAANLRNFRTKWWTFRNEWWFQHASHINIPEVCWNKSKNEGITPIVGGRLK